MVFFFFLSFLLANCLVGPELLFPKYFMLQRRLGTIIPTQLQVSPLCSQYVTYSTKHNMVRFHWFQVCYPSRDLWETLTVFLKPSLFPEGSGGVKLSHFTFLLKVISPSNFGVWFVLTCLLYSIPVSPPKEHLGYYLCKRAVGSLCPKLQHRTYLC